MRDCSENGNLELDSSFREMTTWISALKLVEVYAHERGGKNEEI